MRCETCGGSGWVWYARKCPKLPPLRVRAPCQDCGGCGIAHCCDGLQKQPSGITPDEMAATALTPTLIKYVPRKT